MANLDRNKVQALYQSGLSAREAGERLSVTPWVIYKFMKRSGLPRRTRGETNKLKFESSPLSFTFKKKRTVGEEKLLVAGLMLYWGEGTKSGRLKNWTVEFSNSNPEMVKVFLRFLRKIFAIDETRLRMYIFCYPDQNISQLKRFWSEKTNIALLQFPKPYVYQGPTRKIRETKYGTAHLRYSDKRLLLLIEELIGKFARENGSVAERQLHQTVNLAPHGFGGSSPPRPTI